MKDFGKLLDEYREERHISKKDLASRANLSPGYISLLTRGERTKPSLETVNALVRVLNLNEEETATLMQAARPNMKHQHRSIPLDVGNLHKLFEAPFVVGTPIIHPRQFFGRERAVQDIFRILSGMPMQHIAIIGPHFSGKTSLLNYIKALPTASRDMLRPKQQKFSQQYKTMLAKAQSYRWISIDFDNSRMRRQEPLLRHILTQLQLEIPEPCNLDHFMEYFEQQPLTQPVVILFDGFDVALPSEETPSELDMDFWETLRSLASTYARGNLAFIVTSTEPLDKLAQLQSRPSPFFNIFGHTIETGPMVEEAALELIASSPIPFAEEDVEWIINESHYWPVRLQCLCSERLKSLEYQGEDEDWKEAARKCAAFYQTLT